MKEITILESCPFCGEMVETEQYPVWNQKRGLMYRAMISHKCRGNVVGVYLLEDCETEIDAQKEITKAWNRRSDNGRDQ